MHWTWGIIVKLRPMLMVTATIVAGPGMAAASDIGSVAQLTPAPATQYAPQADSYIDLDALRSNSGSGALGLRPNPERAKEGISLPFGLNYSSEAKALLLSIDEKSEWGLSFNLDVNKPRAVELVPSASSLGLRPKRTPGFTLQKKF
jgi:hypothetical protein